MFAFSHLQDDELIRRVADGELEAFRAFYHRYHPRLIRFVSRLIRRRDLVEETVNDALLAVWQQADRFRGDSRVSTWVLGIAYRVAMKRLRTVARQPEEPLPERLRLVEPQGADTELNQRQRNAALRRAVDRLPADQRSVIELTFFEEFSYQEIAAIMECPENTVKTRMFHARRKLRRWLETIDNPEGQAP